MIYYLANNATKQFSYNSLARIVEIKHPDTVKNYLEYIESTYLLSQVMRFDWSGKKINRLSKKIYFIDNAIINALPSDSISRGTPLSSAGRFLLLGSAKDLQPSEHVRAGRTKKDRSLPSERSLKHFI